MATAIKRKKMLDDLPKGFRAGATDANFKKKDRDDLGLIFSDAPCQLAAMFTTNVFCAAPVRICRKILAKGETVRAIIANSGQANACTGEEGLRNCEEIQDLAAADLHIRPDEILPISTGVIGAQFDMAKWRAALPRLIKSLGSRDAEGFTRAFMTTDAFPKFACRDLELSSGSVRLTVMAKGAGMICPNMATMLCVALTDAKMDEKPWRDMFSRAVEKTFNRISVDGDTSTNDTILGLANGASGVACRSDGDLRALEEALTEILAKVAHMLVKDGEGASKVLHITVEGAASEANAARIARSVGNSQLVKTAIYGGDANWGRIVNAVGYSGVAVNPEAVSLYLCGIQRFKNGCPINDDKEAELSMLLKAPDIDVRIILGDGPGTYTLLASDLGHEYVTLNSDYRS